MNIKAVAIILGACIILAIGLTAPNSLMAEDRQQRDNLSPRGKIHIPIGIADTVDTLKTFVEAEGAFSPGVGSFGVYFWIFDRKTAALTAPTMDSVRCDHGLEQGKYLIPFSKWDAADISLKTEVCQVRRTSPKGDLFVVGSRVVIENTGSHARSISLYAAIRPIGPAGFDIKEMSLSPRADALLVDGHPAIVADQAASSAGVLPHDTVGSLARQGRTPGPKHAISQQGNCSGTLRFDLAIDPGRKRTYGFVCPVLPGRRAVGHKWDGVADWAQFDLADLNPAIGGQFQPDPGLDYYRKINVAHLFAEAKQPRELADCLLAEYDEKFAANLAKAYGSYSVLWPCRLYPIDRGKAHEQFKNKGKQNPSGWRYFPLATAHQGLLAGNREAGYKTLEAHLNHDQMRRWYAFDEGGKSGAGGWGRVRTTWNPNVAMPHGWAIAELWLLLRDSLLFEDGDRLILFAGVPPKWFKDSKGIQIAHAPTYFGKCSVKYAYDSAKNEATMDITGPARPPGGFALRMPPQTSATIRLGQRQIQSRPNGDFILPPNSTNVTISF